jgi:acyl carrier protein
MMNEIRIRLERCFSAVFSEIDEGELHRLTKENTADWDSLANFSLIAVIEEEFGIQIGPEAVDRFLSFESVLEYVQSQEFVSS